MQKTFVKEYVEVMAPVACGLRWSRLSIVINTLYYQVSTVWVTWPASCEFHYLAVFGKCTSRWHQQSLWYSVWCRNGTASKKVLQYIPSLNLTGWKIKSRLQNIFSLSLDKSSLLFASLCPVNILRWCFCVQLQNGETFVLAVGDGQWISTHRH